MEQQAQKKAWKTPELIILVRGKPEEAVLEVCKTTGPNGEGPITNFTACSNPIENGTYCVYCSDAGTS